jgi:hypothetical protein
VPQERRRSQLMPKHRQALHDRGITDEVIDGAWAVCRYASYRRGDVKSLLRRAPQYEGQRWLNSLVGASDGIIIIRREFDAHTWDRDLRTLIPHAHLAPQIRSDRPPWESAKYLFPKDHKAKFIDCHPMARNRIRKGKAPHYYCLEGSLNADAVLSAGAPAYSVPGVAMWDAENLWDLLPSMRKAPAVSIVTDNDWRTNPAVALQARQARELLVSKGVSAIAVAPPLWMPTKSGVGDLLAAHHALEDLEAVPLDPPDPDAVTDRIDALPPRSRPRSRELADILVGLRTPCFHASKVKGKERDKRIERAVLDLADAKVIEETKPSEPRWDGRRWTSSPATWAWNLDLLT